jgi:hypothetical protein
MMIAGYKKPENQSIEDEIEDREDILNEYRDLNEERKKIIEDMRNVEKEPSLEVFSSPAGLFHLIFCLYAQIWGDRRRDTSRINHSTKFIELLSAHGGVVALLLVVV